MMKRYIRWLNRGLLVLVIVLALWALSNWCGLT